MSNIYFKYENTAFITSKIDTFRELTNAHSQFQCQIYMRLWKKKKSNSGKSFEACGKITDN